MPKYTVCLGVYAEKYITVEAESEKEAKTLAEESEENDFSLCNYCSQQFELAECTGTAISCENQP